MELSFCSILVNIVLFLLPTITEILQMCFYYNVQTLANNYNKKS